MVLTTQEHISNRLAYSSLSYLRNGLTTFHSRDIGILLLQSTAGNIAVAIELMLKTLISQKRIDFLFTDAPDELKDALKHKRPLNEKYDVELKSFQYKTIMLDQCISIFYSLYPGHKKTFKPYLKLVAYVRNTALHSFLPEFQKYELEIIAYTAIKLYKFLSKRHIFSRLQFHDFFWFSKLYLSKEDEQFYKEYDEALINKVKDKVINAKNKAKTSSRVTLKKEINWNFIITPCTICESDGKVYGKTEVEDYGDPFEDEDYDFELFFKGESFECTCCGLKLENEKEISLTNLYYDMHRSEEDMDQWITEGVEKTALYLKGLSE